MEIRMTKMGLIDVCNRIANVTAEPGDKVKKMADASIEIVKIIEEFFPVEEEQEKEKENKATEELSDLEELLFRRTYLAYVQYHRTFSDVQFGRYASLHNLVIDADLKEKYRLWKVARGYE